MTRKPLTIAQLRNAVNTRKAKVQASVDAFKGADNPQVRDMFSDKKLAFCVHLWHSAVMAEAETWRYHVPESQRRTGSADWRAGCHRTAHRLFPGELKNFRYIY
jgi:hypothetical protein